MQPSLFKDGYAILQVDTGEIGINRLKRFLKWLDKTGRHWTEPDIEAYGDYLRDKRNRHPSTAYQNMQNLRAHYIAILSNPENYDHIPKKDQPKFVNTILEALGFNTGSVNYEALTRDDEFISENMKILLPPNSFQYKNTQITAFIYWLDQNDYHWTHPNLLEYKQHLHEEETALDSIYNTMNAIRRRYSEVAENEDALETLSEEARESFLQNMRKRLGYADQFPSRTNPTREMLEDDPFNQNYLTPHQVRQLLDKPDPTIFTGKRDRALIALCLATGIQQFEACGVEVEHLRDDFDGQLALFVPESKQREERRIPYDDHEWVLDWINTWLEEAEITESFVFRGTYGNRDVLRPHGIAPETASDILSRYPIAMHGTEIPLLFGDLRATCARRWYDADIPLDEIDRRLGISNRRTSLNLLGVRVRKIYGG